MTWTDDDVKANLPTLKKFVAEGLTVGGLEDKHLQEIVVLDTTAGDFASYVEFDVKPTSGRKARKITPKLRGIWQLVYTSAPPIDLGPRLKPEFGPKVSRAAKQWATEVRQAELKWALTRICRQSTWDSTALDPATLSKERVLILDSSLGSRFDDLQVKWSTDHPGGPGPTPTKVVVYEADEPRPVITRLQDFELTGRIDSKQHLQLTLTAIVMLRNFNAGRRHGSLTPAPPAAPPPPSAP